MGITVDETIERMERLYATVMGVPPPTTTSETFRNGPNGGHTWSPPVVIAHREEGLEIAIDLPGVTADQLKVLVEHHRVLVLGTRDLGTSSDGRRVVGCEVPHGSFARSFELAEAVSPEAVAARLADGVLTIRIATSKREAAAQIPIKS
jgi:HSP20 family protein